MSSAISNSRAWTMIGIVVALVGMPAVVFTCRLIVGEATATSQAPARELVILGLLAILI